MNYRSFLVWAGAVGLLAGCSAARDVSVQGEVTDPDSLASSKSVVVAFYERQDAADAGAEGDLAFIDTISLDDIGAFDETVPVEGSKLYAIAFVDDDGDEACTDGEAWGDTEVTIADDDTASVSIKVQAASACPAMPGQ
jgi:hypothetical protein